MPLATLQALSVHPFADEFPYLTEDETLELAQDIHTNGLLHPVVLFENEILDGRNRLRALGRTDITSVPVEEYTGTDPVGYIVSLNLTRRHLTTGQRAALAVVALPYYEAAAAERIAATQFQSGQGEVTLAESGQSGKAAEIVAEKFGVGGQAVTRAKSLSLNAPDLFTEMKAGGRTVNDAYSELQRRQGKSPGATAGNKTKPEPAPEYGTVTGADTSWDREGQATYEERRAAAAEVLIRTATHMAAQITRYALTDGDLADAGESLSPEAARTLADFFGSL
jgi:ParB-like chromosome segregation protein Spo0J